MKKLILASAIAMMCLSANAFAEDDGYGNDIPAARVEGTVDDGYGNKLPSNQPEYKSFEDARSSSRGGAQGVPFNLGLHLAFGLGTYWDYPTDRYLLDYFGENDWLTVNFDIGGIAKIKMSNLVSIVPEVNFGFYFTSREIGRGHSSYYGNYKVEESRTLINVNVPVALRFTPVPYAFVEAGARFNFNLGTSHTMDYYDEDGQALKDWKGKEVSRELDKWEAKAFIPSFIAGLGGTVRASGHELDLGIRFILDLVGVEKDDKIDFTYEGEVLKVGDQKLVVENNTKMWAIQFYVNYFLF